MNSIGATIAIPFVLPFVGIGYINGVYNKYKTKKHLEIVLSKYGIQNLVYDEELFIAALNLQNTVIVFLDKNEYNIARILNKYWLPYKTFIFIYSKNLQKILDISEFMKLPKIDDDQNIISIYSDKYINVINMNIDLVDGYYGPICRKFICSQSTFTIT
jgi:hypothetical protein